MRVLQGEFGKSAKDIYKSSELLQYLNVKTRSASKGSKSRGSFGNHYAVYVLVEDYAKGGYSESGDYQSYEGAKFTDLFRRQRELPFGSKLQNHALNHRMNQEFRKYFPTCEYIPILRNAETNRYWFNENLLRFKVAGKKVNIAQSVLEIIDAYIASKRDALKGFINACRKIRRLQTGNATIAKKFIADLFKPNIDARIFEIVSFAVLKEYYSDQSILWGWTEDDINKEFLALYKTGRTNANDGGIDFVMRPLGRFFQVTETMDVRKYFLDIDKVQHYPITFVVKSTDSVNSISAKIRKRAQQAYGVTKIVHRYMDCVEEIINIPILLDRFKEITDKGNLEPVITEIILWSKVEFDYEEK